MGKEIQDKGHHPLVGGKNGTRGNMAAINAVRNTPEKNKALNVSAGISCGKARRRRKAMREIARTMLDTELRANDELRKLLNDRGFEDFTEAAAIILAQMNKARNGDTEAAKFLRDTSGQRPADQLAIGNLEDKPFETLDLTALSNDELQELISVRRSAYTSYLGKQND